MCNTFVIDLDGTLLQNDGKLHNDVCNYLLQLQEQGYTVVIATGRNYVEAEEILIQLKLKEHKNAAILCDGQYLIDYQDNTETVAPFLMYPDDYIRIMNCFGKIKGTVKLITMEQVYDVFSSIFSFNIWKRFFSCAMKNRNPFKGLIICHKNQIKHIEKITVKPHNINDSPNADADKQYQVAFVNDKKRFEFKFKGVNKSEMLKKYMTKYGIEEDRIFVFGNDENDLCLFNDFSNSFVVNTARENVKVRAREVIQHCEGLGITEKIKQILKEE